MAGPSGVQCWHADPSGLLRCLSTLSSSPRRCRDNRCRRSSDACADGRPIVGGWITQTFSWHWLFLINIIPGLMSGLCAAFLLPKKSANWSEARTLDLIALGLLAVALSAIEIGLKEAPNRGWASIIVLGCFGVTLVAGGGFVLRVLRRAHPIVELRTLSDSRFTVACLLNFMLGVGVFGSTYMMPVFLALVRGHDALAIGQIMLVTGVAQLLMAPIAATLEKRTDARLLSAIGFLLLAVGLLMSTTETITTDYAGMFWPQVVRGVALMFCVLPPTRLALGHLSLEKIPDASGLFNLMRNLGGAFGIALIDTVIFGRAPAHARMIAAQLKSGDVATAEAVGIPIKLFLAHRGETITPAVEAMLRPLVERLALVRAINEAWLLVAALVAASILSILSLVSLPTSAARTNSQP